jgi:hypothetical protein
VVAPPDVEERAEVSDYKYIRFYCGELDQDAECYHPSCNGRWGTEVAHGLDQYNLAELLELADEHIRVAHGEAK